MKKHYNNHSREVVVMKSKFALSFGVALIFIGCVNFFLETNNVILFGVSLSAFIFSIISILFATLIHDEKYELLYIIPLVVMLSFLCYGSELMKISFVKEIINSRLTSALTFISFGISFASEYIIEKNFNLLEKIKHQTISLEIIDYTQLLQDALIEHLNEACEKKIVRDEVSKKFIDKVEKIYNEKAKESRILHELLSMKKDNYTIDDIKKVYIKNTKILQVKPFEPEKTNEEDNNTDKF